jgi:hypothetical protein
MALTERQYQCFIHGEDGQIEGAHLENYERARQATSLQGEMYWWTAVFHTTSRKKDRRNIAADIVREMLLGGREERQKIHYYDRIDDVVFSSDKDLLHEARHAEKKEGKTTTMIVENEDPQMHEQPSAELSEFLMLLEDLANICNGNELRALAYFLVKTDLDKYLDYIPKHRVSKLTPVVDELYVFLEECPMDKQKFIGGTRWHTTKAELALREKLKSLLPL